MTFWQFVSNNWTKILGTASTMLTTLMTLIASGAFDGLLDPSVIKWLGIAGMLIGSATVGVGFNNSAKARVAEAMETAIKSSPPQSGFARISMLAFVAALATLLLSACATNPDGSRELTATSKIALQEVAAIVVSRHFRESPRAAEHAQKIRAVLTDIAQLPDVTTVAGLRQIVQARIDERVTDQYDREDYTRLLNILSAVLSDYVGSGQLDAQARVKVTEFLGDVAAAIPEVRPAA